MFIKYIVMLTDLNKFVQSYFNKNNSDKNREFKKPDAYKNIN